LTTCCPKKQYEKDNQWLKEWGQQRHPDVCAAAQGRSADKVNAKIKRMVHQARQHHGQH
jgi:hypothetical protein